MKSPVTWVVSIATSLVALTCPAATQRHTGHQGNRVNGHHGNGFRTHGFSLSTHGRNGNGKNLGLSLPIPGENMAVNLFTKLNPKLELDPDNFLVDTAGAYAKCHHAHDIGPFPVVTKTPEGESIGGLRGVVDGDKTDSIAVDGYIERLLNDWITSSEYLDQITIAEKFGCSVKPGCNGRMVMACLYSPAIGAEDEPSGELVGPIIERPLPEFTKTPETTNRPPINPSPEEIIIGAGLAYTEDQYRLAESITKRVWDPSHFLENLSALENSCFMVGKRHWSFANVRREAGLRNMEVKGRFGWIKNTGDTQQAMIEVMKSWGPFLHKPHEQVGCSVQADCENPTVPGDKYYVVVTCLFRMPEHGA